MKVYRITVLDAKEDKLYEVFTNESMIFITPPFPPGQRITIEEVFK